MQKINITKPINLSKFDYVNKNIRNIKHKTGVRYLKVYYPNKNLLSKEAVKDIEEITEVIDGVTYKGRPATVEELAMYDDENFIVALGEKFSDDSGEDVACRGVFGSGRDLSLYDWAYDWGAHCRFLVAFDVPEPAKINTDTLTCGSFQTFCIENAITLLKNNGYKITKEH